MDLLDKLEANAFKQGFARAKQQSTGDQDFPLQEKTAMMEVKKARDKIWDKVFSPNVSEPIITYIPEKGADSDAKEAQ